ncbi:RHS repeat-associated core domain-containing protein [Janibacter indicus]|uniref:RHS repeat-associated core domain-containing protein n=1 Tax=Janibacter indicus TaxID=857417 RepID=A0A1W1Y9U4_9MICO|nr:RHS repeat-associated core domain-containing protein [Janibacter indicus]
MENTYDGSGRVTRQVDGAGKTWTLAWDATGDVATVTDPAGGRWVDTYSGRVLMSRKDPAGNVESFQYDQDLNRTVIDAGGPTQVRQTFDARGNVLTRTAPGDSSAVQTLTYNAKDQVTSRTDYRGNKTTMSYSGHRLASVTSPKGEVTKYSWTALGLPATVTAAGGGVTRLTYDAVGQVVTMTAPGGQVTTYTHDAAGRVASVADPRSVGAADPDDFTKRLTYDAAGNLATVTATDGAKTTLTYDVDGRVSSSQTASATGAVLTSHVLERDGLDRVTKTTDAGGNVESFVYDSRGNLTAVTDAAGAKTTYGYDARNLMTSKVTARGNAAGANAADYRWTYLYDSRGRMVKQTDPTGAVTSYVRDGWGGATRVTDPDGRVTSMAYDGDGQLTKVTDALSRVSEYSYDVNGRQVGVKEPGLGARTSTYDADGNVTRTASPSGSSVTAYAYDANGLVESVTSPRGTATATADDYVTSFERDAAGNVITSTNALGRATRASYDGENRVRTRTSARGGKTSWTYDGLGRAVTVTTPSGAVTSWTYDDVGNVSKLTNGRGKSTTYTHSPRGEVTSSTDPLGRKETFTYDEEGLLVKTVTARGHADGGARMDEYTIRASYDPRGLRTSVTTSSADSSSTWSYSPGGDLTKVVDATGTTTMTYDAGHQLTGVASPMGAFAYTYSPWGAVASRTLPNHGSVEFGFDTDGRVTSSKSNTETTTFGYDRDDHLTSITYPAGSGLSQTRAYNQVGATTDVHTTRAGALVSRYQYTYDTTGNPYRETISRGTKVTQTSYNHDLDDRLIKECHNASGCTSATDVDEYTYNATSGITRIKYGNGVDARVAYDDADQPVKIWDAATGSEPAAPTAVFDADGYPIGNADGDVEFDPLGRMVKNEPWQASYQYNAFGNRVGVTRGGSSTTLAWDNNNPLPMLAQQGPSGGEPTRTYRYDPTGAPISSTHPSGAYGRSWFVTDRQGSVREALKTDGAVAYRHDYQGFGRQETPSKATARVATQLGYTGEYTDTFTGTVHLRARDYLGTGAFYAPDPITLGPPAPSVNPYQYVGGRPLTDADPSGLRPIGGTDDVACMNCRLTSNGWSFGNENVVRDVYDKTVRYDTRGGSGLPSVWGSTYSGDKYTGAGRHYTETYVPEVRTRGEQMTMAVIMGVAYMTPIYGQFLMAIDIADMSQDGFTQEECAEIAIGFVPGSKLGRGVSGAAKADVGLSGRGLVPAAGTRIKPVGIPEGWRITGTKSSGGVLYRDPTNAGNSVRVMQGNPNSPFPNSQAPYVRWQRNGRPLDQYGNELPSAKVPEAHIPLSNFRFVPEVFGP